MPIYEYECEKCGNVFEAFQSFSDRSLTKCSSCSGKLHKIISQSTFHLKGSGWYVTDYAGKSQNAQTKQKSDESASLSDSKGDSPKSEKKPSGTAD